MAELEAAGVHALTDLELETRDARGELFSGTSVVIRAHGIAPKQREKLLALGARIVDATCPRVLASQRKAAAYAAKGWKVVIAGDEGHGEVVGIAGHAPGSVVIGIPTKPRRWRLGVPTGRSCPWP